MKRLQSLILVILVTSCKISPEPITYGSDGCHYCSMTIVDQQHAAQFVTVKGRAYKFDSIECMMNHLQEVDADKVALFRTNDFGHPGELIDATKATYLISTDIPSPMGEFLSAFGSRASAELVQQKHGGELFTWEELQEHFKNKRT